jgi:hypothetical protein
MLYFYDGHCTSTQRNFNTPPKKPGYVIFLGKLCTPRSYRVVFMTFFLLEEMRLAAVNRGKLKGTVNVCIQVGYVKPFPKRQKVVASSIVVNHPINRSGEV